MAFGTVLVLLGAGFPGTTAGAASAKYPKATFTTESALYSGFCSHAPGIHGSWWSAPAARATIAGAVSVNTCRAGTAKVVNPALAAWEGGWSLFVPVHLRTGLTPQWVNSTWRLNWSSTVRVAVTDPCRGAFQTASRYGFLDCSVAASVSISAVTYVYDATGSVVYWPAIIAYPSAYAFAFRDRATTCAPTCTTTRTSAASAGPVPGGANASYSISIPSANASHRWYLVSTLVAIVTVRVGTAWENFTAVHPLNATAFAALDMRSAGLGTVLVRLTVT